MCLGMKETTQISTRGDTEARSDFDKRDDSEGRAVSDHDQRRSTASATRRRSSGRATALPRPRQGDAVADFAAHPNRFGRGRGGRIRGKAVRKRGSNEAGGAVVAAKSPWWWRLAAQTRSGPSSTCRACCSAEGDSGPGFRGLPTTLLQRDFPAVPAGNVGQPASPLRAAPRSTVRGAGFRLWAHAASFRCTASPQPPRRRFRQCPSRWPRPRVAAHTPPARRSPRDAPRAAASVVLRP